ncbi:hypothetical protein FB45DRAFT_1027400 [Roridomyces roridus]|uniref:Uncharacterized protein n=1 Tax=Roridomyces roridus TaxID=1738132 RepID=A0AAD7BSY1_9AGAR|nr:hypothetical protein FB45DRAFT_1027400 [Roridomyces roridus]
MSLPLDDIFRAAPVVGHGRVVGTNPHFFADNLRQAAQDPLIVQLAERRYRQLAGNSEAPVCCGWCTRSLQNMGSLFFCEERCCGEVPACAQCISVLHERAPFHTLEEWIYDGEDWDPGNTLSAFDVDYVYQMGHEGLPCPRPSSRLTQRAVTRPDGGYLLWCRGCRCNDAAGNARQSAQNAVGYATGP